MTLNLNQFGWNQQLDKHYQAIKQEGLTVGRVLLEHKSMYRLITEHGELLAEVSGKYRFSTTGRADFPAVGDWVVIEERVSEGKATIHHLLPRFSKFSRKIAGSSIEEQIVAANIDTVFIVQSMNQDFNPRRLERYLMMAWESGASPVIVLTKSDLCDKKEAILHETQVVAFDIPVYQVSVVTGIGLENLKQYFEFGKTIALLGSSGTGKSTLINYLLGETKQITQDIREDDKGRHTTTYRELIQLPYGGLIMDTPGMREIQLWDTDTGLDLSFQDIESLAEYCQFRDCTHKNEPNCAVKKAIRIGELDEARLSSYFKLQKELNYIKRKNEKHIHIMNKKKWHDSINRKFDY